MVASLLHTSVEEEEVVEPTLVLFLDEWVVGSGSGGGKRSCSSWTSRKHGITSNKYRYNTNLLSAKSPHSWRGLMDEWIYFLSLNLNQFPETNPSPTPLSLVVGC
jgi:hypothetical protein